MRQLVECVPNFSNGRDPEVYNSIAAAIQSVAGSHVLDISADADHNRTVITFVGTPAAVEEAAFRAIGRAAEIINLDEHEGEHPRIGATDVCPFIPIRGTTIEDCVAMAKRLGQRVGDELGIAVYLYGDAAARPEREKLSSIRKGEYELWKSEVAKNPSRMPDYGPAEPKPCGATVIGVRQFLIAYNIYLNSDDVEIADKIAREVRFIGGGLRFVQAKGFQVEGKAQVSMNLTNFEKTPIYRVQELVRREAARYGLSILKAELVGLIPQKALVESARWYLQLDDLRDEQVLEHRLHQESEDTILPIDYLAATAAATPTPGGGSAAALVGALGASLTQMVAGLTIGRKKYAEVEAEAEAVHQEAARLRQSLTDAITQDMVAFEGLMDAYRNKELDEAARASLIQEATLRAAEVPLQVARLSHDVALLADEIARIGNANAVTDAAAAGLMARTAAQTAGLNVKINVVSLKDEARARALREEVETLEAKTADLADRIMAAAAERGGF